MSYFLNKAYFLRIIMGGVYSLILYCIINLPFYNASVSSGSLINKILDFMYWFPKNTFRAVNDYPYATANGFNLWTLFRGQTIPDSEPLFFLTYAAWSKILLVCLWIFVIFVLIAFKDRIFSYYFSSFLLAVGFFMFSTRVHEKYMLPAVIFITACLLWSKKLWASAVILSGCIFTNIYYAYHVAKIGNPWFLRDDGYGYFISFLSLAVFIYSIYFVINQLKLMTSSDNIKDRKPNKGRLGRVNRGG